jgi:hypothetical protein
MDTVSENQKHIPLLGDDVTGKNALLACRSVCIALAILELWAGQRYTDPDGISYLDMSDWLIQHNWHLLINPHWGPLYPLLLGLVTWLFRPSPYWELPLVHVVNFLIFIGALASFDFLLRQVIRASRSRTAQLKSPSPLHYSTWRWTLLGYSIFVWSTFVLLRGVRIVNPDLCVEAFVFLDAALVLKLRSNPRQLSTFLLLGVALGFGYLAKAILFPMALVFMLVAFLAVGQWRKTSAPLLATFLVFCLIAAPQIYAVSRMVGRPSFSESGNLNIVWQINGRPMFPLYRSEPPGGLKHPLTLLHTYPNVFSLVNPVEVSTYPLWYDPQYWNAGARPAISAEAEIRTVRRNLIEFVADVRMIPFWLLAGVGTIILLIAPDRRAHLQNIARVWALWLPGVTGLAAYSLVLVGPGYVAPFIPLVLLGLFAGILFPVSKDLPRSYRMSLVIVAGAVAVFAALFTANRLVAPLPIFRVPGGVYYQVAKSLNNDGVSAGQAVGIIGSGWDAMNWARMGRLHIVAQIPPEDAGQFWELANPEARASVYDAFEKAGAKAVVTEQAASLYRFPEWKRLGNTTYSVCLLGSSRSE